MSALAIKAVRNFAGTGVHFAEAVRADHWIFLNGHEAYDFATGFADEVDGPLGFPSHGRPPLRREADYIIHRMRNLLRQHGSDLTQSIRVDQFYTDPSAVFAYHLSRHTEFGQYIPPSSSLIVERCLGGHANISTSLIAIVPDSDWKIEAHYPDNVPVPKSSGFAPVVSCNDFVFVAGQMAGTHAGLDPSVLPRPNVRWGGLSPMRLQTEFLIKKLLEPALQSAGSSLRNALKAQVYVDNVANIPDFLEVWNYHLGRSPCALTVIPVKSFAVVGGVIEINLIGIKDNGNRKKQIIDAALPAIAAYGPSIRCGELVFLSGLMAVDADGWVVGHDRARDFIGICRSGHVQGAQIFDYAEQVCKAAGTSMANTLRAQYFVTDIREFAGITAAWQARYGAQPHPFSCVEPCPRFPASGATVTADFWLYVPD